MRNCWKTSTDPSRCDFDVGAVPIIETPVLDSISSPLTTMARRKPVSWDDEREARKQYQILEWNGDDDARNLTLVQDEWDHYLDDVYHLGSEKFWSIYLPMHTLSSVAIDKALGVVKKRFLCPSDDRKKFHSSKRALQGIIRQQVEPFWEQVMHSCQIDVSTFNLPSGTKSINFKFVDPVWGWLMAARQQNPDEEMHWRPVAQPRTASVYGGGIQFGEMMKQVCEDLPRGAYPMFMDLHWDGTGALGLTSSPICVGVGNTNSCKGDTQFCIAYIPHVPDEYKPEWRKIKDVPTAVKFYIRQQCASNILRVMEEAAVRGVKCRMLNTRGNEVEILLFPRLSAMNFDQPEAQLFFGLQNKYGCSKCRNRLGYSQFRRCKHQKHENIARLYQIANDPDSPHKKKVQEKLHRYGFNYKRECCLQRVCDKLLVSLPGLDEVFPCVDYRDRMHGVIIFLHRHICYTLNDLIRKQSHRRILDQRLSEVCKRGFRVDGVLVPKQHSIFSETGMRAKDRVVMMLLLSHVIGPAPDDIIPERVYHPLVTALATAQLILIAVSGRRSYTKDELEHIFDRGYVLLFGALESIREQMYHTALETWSTSDNGPPPKRFKPMSRFIHAFVNNVVESSFTQICLCITG